MTLSLVTLLSKNEFGQEQLFSSLAVMFQSDAAHALSRVCFEILEFFEEYFMDPYIALPFTRSPSFSLTLFPRTRVFCPSLRLSFSFSLMTLPLLAVT